MPKSGFKVVIPARYGSTRLPGKPLLNIAGKPMIVHVCMNAIKSGAEEVVVATDDARIFSKVQALDLHVVMTDTKHQSGSERINEVATKLGWNEDDVVVNLQGDEPLITPVYIKEVALALGRQTQANMATLATKIIQTEEIINPNLVKVVLNKDGYALYFSRAVIPYNRDFFANATSNINHIMSSTYLRHIGLYAYTVKFLQDYCTWETTKLETLEALEQLRVLWQGQAIYVHIVSTPPEAGVDTKADLARVEKAILGLNT